MNKTEAARAVLEALKGLEREESDQGAEALAQALEALLAKPEAEGEAQAAPAKTATRKQR